MGFSQAVSGLSAASDSLDVIGNNISNAETVGFKSSKVSFADMYASSSVGLGVTVATVSQDFSDGTVTSTDVATDIAISGTGFFRLEDDNGNVYYTRNGEFELDENNNLVNKTNGMYLTGYSATDGVINTGATPTVLTIDTSVMAASATTSADVVVNLDSSSDTTTFDVSDSSTYDHSETLTTYDSQGNVHNINLYFVKTADNTWDVYAQDTSDSSVTDATNIGTLNFDSSGQLTGTTEFTISINSVNGSAASSFTIDFASSTQQSGDSSTSSKSQDGYAMGTLSSYEIGDDGVITGTYSNGESRSLGQIVLASFANTNGLKSEGDNLWSETTSSGQPILGVAGSGSFGSLTAGALEESNVETSEELVNLIVAQRNYQANAQTIKTQDAILNTLVNLR